MHCFVRLGITHRKENRPQRRTIGVKARRVRSAHRLHAALIGSRCGRHREPRSVGRDHPRFGVVETAGLALHNEKPKRIFCLLDQTGANCGSICAHAPIASSAASCLRPRRPSADALSSVISYSRVANPERRGSDAMNGAPNVACRRAFIRRSPGYSRHLGRTRQSGTLYRPTLRTL